MLDKKTLECTLFALEAFDPCVQMQKQVKNLMLNVKEINIYSIVLRSSWWRGYDLMTTKWCNPMDYEANRNRVT